MSQSWQIKDKIARSNIGSVINEELDNQMTLIDDKLTRPMDVTVSSNVITIGASVKQVLESNGADSTQNSYKWRLPISSGIDFNIAQSTLDLTNGNTTGAFANNPDSGKSVTSGNYIQMGIALRSDKKLYIVWGDENAVLASTTPPAFADDEIKQVLVIKLHNDGTTGAWNFVTPAKSDIEIVQSAGGGSSSGTGSAGGGEIVDTLFKARIVDEFASIPDGTTPVDIAAGKTSVAAYEPANKLFRISYDASKTVTGTGINMTISSAPTFTVVVGDILIYNSEARKIITVTSQTVYVLESAFTVDPSASACCVSQAIHTQDLNGTAFDGLAVSSQFTGNVSDMLVGYADSTTSGDKVPDYGTAPVVAFTCSATGTDWSGVKQRVTSLNDAETFVSAPTPGTYLYLRFFANKTSGSGQVNVLSFKALWHKEYGEIAGTDLWTAFARPGSNLYENCTHSVVAGHSRITFTKPYGRGLDGSTASGSALQVFGNGQNFPRYNANVDLSQGYFTEIDDSTIELDQDYSLTTTQFLFKVPQLVVDTRTLNTSRIANIETFNNASFDDYVVGIDTNREENKTYTVPYTTIVNRKKIVNPLTSLEVVGSVKRMMTQQLYRIADESGPNGEPVWGVIGDKCDQVRFVGAGWANSSGTNGTRASGLTNDYLEITFYGTGLNFLAYPYTAAASSIQASVDGGALGSNLNPASSSNVIALRSYSMNTILPVVSGMTLGLHTVKLLCSVNNIESYGFEILNESSTLKGLPGSYYVNKNIVNASTIDTPPFKPASYTGTKGCSVVNYKDALGVYGQVFTAVPVSPSYYPSADHSNEEMIREYFPREFGCGRSDDFSTKNKGSTADNRAFTLDDNLTTLVAYQIRCDVWSSGVETFFAESGTTPFITKTFFGTGLDILAEGDTTTRSYTVFVDGVSQGTITINTAGVRTVKICSGLPLGTHTVKLLNPLAGAAAFGIISFKTYSPKTPSLPLNVIPTSKYYVLADYVANTTAGVETLGTGVVRKQASQRESVFVGTWAVGSMQPTSEIGALQAYTSTNGSYYEMTFIGTGFEHRAQGIAGASTNISVTLNGLAATTANYPTLVSSVYGFTSFISGVLNAVGSSANGSGLKVAGLPFGKYTVRFTNNTTAYLYVEAFDIITPIYSPTSQTPYDLQNTLTVGNTSLCDLRKVSPVSYNTVNGKAVYKAVGVASGPTTGSSTAVPMPDMSLTVYSKGGMWEISFAGGFSHTVSVTAIRPSIYVDGVAISSTFSAAPVLGSLMGSSMSVPYYLSKGTHKVDVYWYTSAATATAYNIERILTAKEL